MINYHFNIVLLDWILKGKSIKNTISKQAFSRLNFFLKVYQFFQLEHQLNRQWVFWNLLLRVYTKLKVFSTKIFYWKHHAHALLQPLLK